MVFVIGAVFLVVYVVALARAAARGPSPIWTTAAAALLFALLVAAVLGWYYDVPSMSRLLLTAAVLAGPVTLFPAVMLSAGRIKHRSFADALPLALAGAVLGLASGYVIVVFGVGVW